MMRALGRPNRDQIVSMRPNDLTTLEAMELGTPVLISKQSGVAEVVHHALKVDFWDIDEMANQIATVLSNQELEVTLVENGQAELSRISWSHSIDKLMHVYERHMVPRGTYV